MDSKALTKIQSVALIAIIVVAAVSGSLAYMFWVQPLQSTETIRIGICTDLKTSQTKTLWQGAVLASEQINAEGGILGRNITIVAEDDDSFTSGDISVGINALTKLLTVDNADYIISTGGVSILSYQDVCCQQKKILLEVGNGLDNYSQRVLDNYEKYKYSFRTYPPNETTIDAGMLGDVLTVANYTGFTKVALLQEDYGAMVRQNEAAFRSSLPEHGLELVYNSIVPIATTDFTSYLAAIEASGAEILFPFMVTPTGLSLVNEWYDRQSPFVIWGVNNFAQMGNFWNLTEGKCDTVSQAGSPAVAGFPLTNKTVPVRQALIQRWGEVPTDIEVGAYDTLRFILYDAIRRAGTTETEAVIKALETTSVETTSARQFVFTPSHDVMLGSGASINNPAYKYQVMCFFQWQNGTQVLVKPESIMKEAGNTYKFPPWKGPWSK